MKKQNHKNTNKRASIPKEMSQSLKSLSHHDKFFKMVFSYIPFARELVSLILSKEEQKLCDLSRLKVEKDSLATKRMDLVLSFPLKKYPQQKVKIFILFEHKSKYDSKLNQQGLDYQADLYRELKKAVIVIPCLFYHGKAPWKWKLSFQEQVLGNFFEKIPMSFRKNMLEYVWRLINTGDKRIQRVFNAKNFRSGVFLEILHKIRDIAKDEKEFRAIISKLLRRLSADKGLERRSFDRFMLMVATYLRSAGLSVATWERFERDQVQKGTLKKGGFMDIREEIRQEGLEEGWLKGRQEGRQEVIFNMLKKQFDIELISEVTGLPAKEIKKLKNDSN